MAGNRLYLAHFEPQALYRNKAEGVGVGYIHGLHGRLLCLANPSCFRSLVMEEWREDLKEIDNKLDDVALAVGTIKTVLLGANGNLGLCQKHTKLAEDYYNFKRKVYWVFGIMIGSGILGGMGYAVWDLIAKATIP